MSDPRSGRSLPRSIGAVLAGFLALAVASTVTDMVLHATGVFPPAGEPMATGLWALATAYRIVFSIGGCYLAARLAPNRPMRHALALGILGVFVSLAGVLYAWDKGRGFGPHWYAIALLVVALPCAWVGGRLYASGEAGQRLAA